MRLPEARPFRPLVPLALSVAGGVWAADALDALPGPAWIGAVLLFGPLAVAARLRRRARVLCCLPWFLIGLEVGARAAWIEPGRDVGRLALSTGRLVEIEGRVGRAPIGGGSGSYTLQVETVGLPRRPAGGAVVCFLDRRPRADPRRGDRVRVVGRLLPLRDPSNPGQADTARRLRRRGVRARLKGDPGCVTRLAAAAPLHPGRRLDDLRAELARIAGARLSPAAAGLFRALLLGERDALDSAFAADFQRGGILHFLAISGLHVALLAGGLGRLLRAAGVPRGVVAVVVVAALVLQAGLAGGRTPVVRAAVLAAGVFVAPTLLRAADPWNLMAGAALLTLLLRPGELFAPGFALSYGAVAGILLFANRLDFGRRLTDWPGEGWATRWRRRMLRAAAGAVAVTVAAWVGSGPIIWEVFGVVHPWVPLTNLAVLPMFGLTLVTALASAVIMPCGGVVAAAAAALFEIAAAGLGVVGQVAAAAPGACVPVTPAGSLALIGCVAVAVAAAAARRLLLLAAIPLLLVGAAYARGRSPAPELTVLDVGQGLSVFVGTGGGGTWLFDLGSTDRLDVTGQVIAPFLRARGVARGVEVFVSHAERDHMSGLAALHAQGRIGVLRASRPARLRVVSDARRTRDGDRGGTRAARWRALHPPRRPTPWLGANDGSLVILAEVAGLSVLLPGDVEEAGLARLVRGLGRQVDVLIMPHHGGWSENLAPFLLACRPRVVLISARRGFPDARTLALLDRLDIPTFVTWRQGALSVRWSPHSLTVRGHRGGCVELSRGPRRWSVLK